MLEASGQIVLLEPWFSNRTKSIVKSPKLYLRDTGLLCALLNIRSEEGLRQSPAVRAVWETFVFAQLRDRERRAGRTDSLFFWRGRTREVDFVMDAGGRLELIEAKWTEPPDIGDTVNLAFVRNVIGKSRVTGGAVVSRTPNSFLFPNGFRALPVTELGCMPDAYAIVWSRRRESNPHEAKLRQILSLLRLPVPPLRASNENSTPNTGTQAPTLLSTAHRAATLAGEWPIVAPTPQVPPAPPIRNADSLASGP
jgi:Domain of unknown function (DUF4143)